MKKIIIFVLVIIGIYANVVFASVGTKDATLSYVGIEIEIDDNKVVPKNVNGNIVEPFLINGTTYLPVRAISEALGKQVTWDGETYSVYINDVSGEKTQESFSGEIEKKVYQENKVLNYNNISIYINEQKIEPKDANGNIVEPFTIEGTTYLPVRAVAEAFEKEVNWINETKTVSISSINKSVAKVTDVVVKVIDETLCAEITTDIPLNSYNYYSITEGRVKAEPFLNMRESSNTTSSVIATIPNGSDITINDVIKEEDKDAWYKVVYDSKTGWVSADYVTITPTRLVIDLKNTSFNIETNSKTINYEIIDSIRFGDQGNNVSRIVLDLNQMTTYNVVQNEDKTVTYFALNEDFKLPATIKGEDVFVATNDDKIYLPDDDNDKDTINNSGDTNNESGDENTVIKNLASVNSVKYSSSNNSVKINIDGDYEYTAFTLTNPNRVVVDIKNAKLDVSGPKEINPRDNNLTAIRFSQNEEDIVRVVFDVENKADYVITEKDSQLTVELEEITYKNITYVNSVTHATLVLKDTDIDYFETEESTSGAKYYITYSARKFKSGKGSIEVNDEFVSEIEIKSNKITIYAEEDISYSMKQVGENVVVTIKKKQQEIKEKVILVDAGHGGSDPGACNGTIYEKVYNLKIALKLYNMLKETDGIDVRISRTDDVFIGREGRLNFVLDNEDADLVVSIHNNSLANKNYQGSMVLFYNKPGEKEEYGITSKEFATIVKNNLVTELETIDRGVVSREDLWILEQNAQGKIENMGQANVPAILCEVIYISNDYEASRLQTEDFQQKTAQAIYDGIIEAISIMDNN